MIAGLDALDLCEQTAAAATSGPARLLGTAGEEGTHLGELRTTPEEDREEVEKGGEEVEGLRSSKR